VRSWVTAARSNSCFGACNIRSASTSEASCATTTSRPTCCRALTQQEVAEALEIPLGTVKSRIAYGLACLRRRQNP
jgi:hypothetical protein